MQHPFSGILPTNQSNSEATTSRRDALKTIAVGAVAVTAISTELLSAAEKTVAEKPTKAGSYDRYLVVPKDFTKMGTANRQRLGITGSFTRLQFGQQQKGGFLAWLSKSQVEQLKKNQAIGSVEKISAANVPSNVSIQQHNQLTAVLMPNSWRKGSAPKGSYQSVTEMIVAWQKQFVKENVNISNGSTPGTIVIKVRNFFVQKGKSYELRTLPKAVVMAVKQHRQVAQLAGAVQLTAKEKHLFETIKMAKEITLRIGEEGGRGNGPWKPPLTNMKGESGWGPR